MSPLPLIPPGALAGAAAVAASGAALGAAQLSPVLWKRAAIARLRRRAVAARALVLTYDDGPGPDTTRALLELLAEHGAEATFFLNGGRVEAHRALAEETAARGHELASHGFAHLHAWKVGPLAHGRDFARGAAAVAGVDPSARGYRPPHGKLVLSTWWRAHRAGARLDWWTDDSGDSFPELPARSPALDALERGGGVVLMHDLDRSAPRNRFVLDTTRALLEGARERGLAVLTLARLAAGDQKPS